MLGNNADAFFTTPMMHRVTSGGNIANQTPMPAPRDLNQSATGMVTTRSITTDFLPLGDDDKTVLAAEPMPEAPTSLLSKAATPMGLALIAGVLFFTPLGKSIRRKIGLG
jgi:hypothetical protein